MGKLANDEDLRKKFMIFSESLEPPDEKYPVVSREQLKAQKKR